ncbi:hypothetical protein HDU99_006563 [Rhizoclosmatium hyalinum]|nr:hypothetical protein HDU99_006563 [Rhizoclosmatium hyalinum]
MDVPWPSYLFPDATDLMQSNADMKGEPTFLSPETVDLMAQFSGSILQGNQLSWDPVAYASTSQVTFLNTQEPTYPVSFGTETPMPINSEPNQYIVTSMPPPATPASLLHNNSARQLHIMQEQREPVQLFNFRRPSLKQTPYSRHPSRLTPSHILAPNTHTYSANEYKFPIADEFDLVDQPESTTGSRRTSFTSSPMTTPALALGRSGSISSSRKLSVFANSGLGSPLLGPVEASESRKSRTGSRKNSRSGSRKQSFTNLTEVELKERAFRKETEKARRDSMREGFAQMKELLPQETTNGVNKAPNQTQILEKVIEYIGDLQRQEEQKEQELYELEASIRALKNM